MGEIIKALAQIQREIDYIGKDKRNQQQGWNFRGVDDVMNTLHPILAKYGVIVIPEVKDMAREEKQSTRGAALTHTLLTITYHFRCEADDSEVTATVIGEGMDSGDKSCNKALSVAYKYALFQVFSIPTEEMDDPDRDAYEVAARPAAAPAPQVSEEFRIACKVGSGVDGMTMGKLYKADFEKFMRVIETGTDVQKKAGSVIYAEMQKRKENK